MKQIETLEELRKKLTPIRNVNTQHKSSLSALDKLALWITDHVGSMNFSS